VVGGGEDGFNDEVGGRLGIETSGFSIAEIVEDAQYVPQPGLYYTNDNGYIKNTGNMAAFVEIEDLNIILTSDEFGITLPAITDYYPAPEGLALTEFTIDPDDPENSLYVYDGVTAARVATSGSVIAIYHFVYPEADGSVRHFLDIPAKGTYNVYDEDGETVIGTQYHEPGVKVETKIDLSEHAEDMGGEWNGFKLDGFRVLATQGAYEEAIVAAFHIDIADLDWAGEVQPLSASFAPLSAGAGYLSPQDVLKARFDAAP
jgi:hypothetical protein